MYCLTFYLLVLCPTSFANQVIYRPYGISGPIFSRDFNGDLSVLSPSTAEPRRLGIVYNTKTSILYWSTGIAIQDSNSRDIITGIIHVTIIGRNFGLSKAELKSITVKGHSCTSVVYVSSEKVKCSIGLPDVVDSVIGDSDIILTTTVGSAQGKTGAFDTAVADGYSFPIVSSISIEREAFLPHAVDLAYDSDGTIWIYWSNIATEKVYRMLENGQEIQELVSNIPTVYGIRVYDNQVYITSAAKGAVYLFDIATSSLTVINSELHFPRGIAVDTANKLLYVTEFMGKIIRIDMLKNPPQKAQVIGLGSQVRLDGIVYDASTRSIYWTEQTTNIVASSKVGIWKRTVIAGNVVDQRFHWPRCMALDSENGEVYIAEYTGRVYKGKLDGSALYTLVQGQLSSLAMKAIHDLVAAANSPDTSGIVYLAMD